MDGVTIDAVEPENDAERGLHAVGIGVEALLQGMTALRIRDDSMVILSVLRFTMRVCIMFVGRRVWCGRFTVRVSACRYEVIR